MNSNRVFLLLMMLWSVVVYAQPLNLRTIKVEYINFNDIRLDNLLGFLGKEYGLNFSINPKHKSRTVSIHLRHSNMHDLLEAVTHDSKLLYHLKNNIIYITSRQQNLIDKYMDGGYRRSRVTLQHASVQDAITFLHDMMPGQAVIRSSTKNHLYSNLYNATPTMLLPDTLRNQGQENSLIYPQTAMLNGGSEVRADLTEEERRRLQRYYGGGMRNERRENVPKNILYIVPFFDANRVYLVSTSRALIAEAKSLLQEIDQPSKQVLIQGKILEFTVGNGYKSIFDFAGKSSKVSSLASSVQSSVGIGNLKYAFLDSNLLASIDIAQNEGRASFVSSPMLLTMNRVSATLDMTEDVSIVTGVKEGSTSTYDSGVVVVPPTPIYQSKKLGTQLEITPYINHKNEILLKVKINISSLSGKSQTIKVPTANGGTESYTVDSITESKIETLLNTANKKSIVFGGLIREFTSKDEKKTPLLGDIPILGIPFRKIENSTEKKELIIILTPTIVDPKNPNMMQSIQGVRQGIHSVNRPKSYQIKKPVVKSTARPKPRTQPKTRSVDAIYNQEIEEFLR